MAIKTRLQAQRKTPTVDLGIAGWRVPIHSHLAYLLETERDFAEAVGFLEAGLRGSDYCVVIGGPRDNERVLAALEDRGIDAETFEIRKRLSFIERNPWARVMLKRISATFEAALAAGAPVVRLFGTVGWGRESGTPDAELLAFEARLTEIAERYPCVILCLHEVHSLTGLLMRHGVFGTHPQTLEEDGVLGNPYFVPLDRFLDRLGAIMADVSERQRAVAERKRAEAAAQRSYEELRALSERLRAVREEESARIAREVHDGVGQMLTVLGMDVAWLEKKLETCPPTVREELSGKLRSMSALLDTAVNVVQRIVTELRPVVLDELGLEAALEGYVAEFQTASGHRLYDEEAVHRMELIRRSQQLGLTLDDIRELLRFKDLPEPEACARVAERLRARIEAIDQQLSTLRTFRRRLVENLELCESARPGACPIVQRLRGVSGAPAEQEKE